MTTHRGPSEEGKKSISKKAKARFQDKDWYENVFMPAWKEARGDFRGENNPMFGKTHSEKTRKKQSEAKKGKYVGSSNPMHGQTHSSDARDKIAAAMKGTIWITNGNETKKIKDGDPIPEGFIKGRKLKTEHYSEIQLNW